MLQDSVIYVMYVTGRGNIFGFGKVFGYELRDDDEDFNIMSLGLGLPSNQGFWNVKRNHGE